MQRGAHPVTGIDHCFALVGDLGGAAAQFADLGFCLSPRGLHSKAKGSANHTIMFPDDYFELLGIVTPTDLNAPYRALLANPGPGLHAIACRVADAAQAEEQLAQLGIATEGLGHFERPVTLPGGATGRAGFSTLGFAPQSAPRGTIFMCEHKTPETVWVPDLLTHPNTACGLDAIFAISPDPRGEGETLARLWADGAVTGADGAYSIDTGKQSATLCLMSPRAFSNRFPGLDPDHTPEGAFAGAAIRVADMGALRACLKAAGIVPVVTAAGLAVPAAKAAGVIVEFISNAL